MLYNDKAFFWIFRMSLSSKYIAYIFTEEYFGPKLLYNLTKGPMLHNARYPSIEGQSTIMCT